MRTFYSSATWLAIFIPKISVLLLISSVQNSEQSVWQSFSASEHGSPSTADQKTHHSNDKLVSLNSAINHGHSNSKSESQLPLEPGEISGIDLRSRAAFALQFGNIGLNVPGSEFPESVRGRRQNRRHRRKNSETSSLFLRRSLDPTHLDSPHQPEQRFKSTDENEQHGHFFREYHDGNQHSDFPNMFRSQEDRPLLTDSDNSEAQEFSDQSDPSPIERRDFDSYSEHHHYGSENLHQRLPTRQVFLNHQQQKSFQHSFQNRNPLSQSDELLLRDSDTFRGQDRDTNNDRLLPSRSENYENEQPLEVPQGDTLESDELGHFPSHTNLKREFILYPELPLRNEDGSERHHQPYDSQSLVTAVDSDRIPINPDLVENLPDSSLSLFQDYLEHQDGEEYPSLDICSEDTHTFYNGAISPSSPLYEIEPFLFQNFNEMFLNELIQKFRPYEHPNVGDNSICNHNLKFDDKYHANVRAMCPFDWEVASYNSSRYPPYLMTARCTCQLSKPIYREWSVCKEKKGQIPVLWRVGCNNGKHVYREGWDEINVACIPDGYVLTPGAMGRQSSALHKPSN